MSLVDEEIRCPGCGEVDALQGRPIDSEDRSAGIRIHCDACSTSWDRVTEVRCPRCDGVDIYNAPVAIIEKSRGSQLSILGTRPTPLCWICDRDIIDAQRQSGTALMPTELPTEDTI
jgi:phage FluMu protein Com